MLFVFYNAICRVSHATAEEFVITATRHYRCRRWDQQRR